MYAVPKARRTKPNQDVDMKPVIEQSKSRENEHKRPRITAPTVETVTNACKKIRLINITERQSLNKRQFEPSPMVT